MLSCQVLIEKLFRKFKHLLIEKDLKKLKTFDLGYFMQKSHFGKDGSQIIWYFSQF